MLNDTRITIRLPYDRRQEILRIARESGQGYGQVIRDILEEHLKQPGGAIERTGAKSA